MDKDIKQTIDYKDAKIKSNMDEKLESIFISGSSRDATLITTTFFQHINDIKDIEKKQIAIEATWEYWQQYFYNYMKNQMPEMPTCATCGKQMKISSKGNWYCPHWKDERHSGKTILPPNEQQFSDSLNNLN